ncbi:MAG: hypothetical protein ACOYCA_04825 [Eggerthellaceae bacterium]|jgi:hypothetical protein
MKSFIASRSEGKDERISSILAPIYRTGFYILAGGVLFDIFSRFNYLARTGGDSLGESVEVAALLAAFILVAFAKARSGAVSDSLQVLNAASFSETGLIGKGVGVSLLIGAAAALGRLSSEVGLDGWGSVIWSADIAIFLVVFALSAIVVLGYQYSCWRSYRLKEDRLAEEDDI